MLERVECKVFLILLSILSLLSLLSTITAMVLSIIWRYVGFMMDSAISTYICSTYLTIKLHYNITYNFNAIFISSCISIIFQILLLVQLGYLLFKYYKSEEGYFQELSEAAIARLYIGCSFSLLGLCIGTGYYASYVIQQCLSCLKYIYSNWMILMAIFAATLVFLLICWVYLLYFWMNNKHKFEQVKEKTVYQTSVAAEEPVNMVGMFEALKQAMNNEYNQTKRPLKQALIQQPIDQDDQFTEVDVGKQKLVLMTFEEYKAKEQQKIQKEINQQQMIQKLLQQDQQNILKKEHQRLQAKLLAQKIKKQKLSKLALSPNDPNFNDMFLESDNEEQAKPVQLKQESKVQYFPANYVPTNEEQRKAFQAYKKKLLNRHKKDLMKQRMADPSLASRVKHPQNIEGGRSKRLLQRFIKASKKPSRDESIYLRTNFQNSGDEPLSRPILQIDEQDEISGQFNQDVPEIVLQAPIQSSKVEQNQKSNIYDTIKSNQQQQQVLFFHKKKVKSQSKKKLFEEEHKYLTNQAFSSVLSSLVKGVQEANFQSKLKDLRKKRNQNQYVSNSKRSQKLLDQIRSKFH